MLSHAAAAVLGPDAACGTEQSSGGEDFAWYLEHVPGAMARFGVWAGHGPMRDLHQPTFDLDERALPSASACWPRPRWPRWPPDGPARPSLAGRGRSRPSGVSSPVELGRLRMSPTYSAGAPAASAASAITPR